MNFLMNYKRLRSRLMPIRMVCISNKEFTNEERNEEKEK